MQEHPVNQTPEWDLVKRVLASELFQKSPKLRDLLTYTASCSLKGKRDLLSEPQIGVAVFGRPSGYNSGDDSIVRVQARKLREKLGDYFQGEGAAEPVIITIPKGRYEVCFSPRPAPADTVSALPRRKRLLALLAALALALIVFTVGIAVGRFGAFPERTSEPSATAPGPDTLVPNPLLRALFAPASQTIVVFEDPLLALASLVRGKPFSLEEFAAPAGSPINLGGAEDDPVRGRLRQMVPTSRFVQQANVTFAVRLLRPYPHLSQSAIFKHAREVQLRDIKSSNCVLFGAQLTNPWVELYESRLNFRFHGPGETRGFENRRPQPGERPVYGEGGELTYARIALLSNFQPETRVLILTGMGSPETEAAAEFVLDPKFLDLIPPDLARKLRNPPSHLEILLATNRLGRTAGSVRVAAWRISDGETAPQ
jgi:hypothetical protein